ncbi:Kynurenine formamidase [Caloramator mitchellensis]|uniref:Kynurenine formamidase n=1 Tax=Caloramator mitchellensis TaxID=908809 RepID=A0A0R3JYR5_CALMK|nr:cyclase family protein [Caloramator mitchellensis]KRQ86382.1 Kynurenine formamidase [Caloramator mitchellensis]
MIIDISMDIHPDMQVYKNLEAKKPKIIIQNDFENDDMFESKIEMNLHTGTHIDAPLHFIKNGETIDRINLNNLITKCKVLDFTKCEEKISINDLINKEINKDDFILLKTKNSFGDEFDFNFVYLDKNAAEYLSEIGIKGIGIDGLGIERAQPGHETHKILLSNGIIIIEGLRLKQIVEGEYQLIALPLKILKAEASPARALLVTFT